MAVIEDGQAVMSMRVVVGRHYRRTPVFSGLMDHIVFNPDWNIPTRIAVQDILPKARKDPAYLSREKIRVFEGWGRDAAELDPGGIDWDRVTAGNFRYKLKKDPGPHNDLGRIKFMFPEPIRRLPARHPVQEAFRTQHARVQLGVHPHRKAPGPGRIRSEGFARVVARRCHRRHRCRAAPHGRPGPENPRAPALHDRRCGFRRAGFCFGRISTSGIPLSTARCRKDPLGFHSRKRRTKDRRLPGAHPADVHMHEVRSGVVPDPAGRPATGRGLSTRRSGYRARGCRWPCRGPCAGFATPHRGCSR
ncbi:MAG: L,D-transpeptidase family protein [Desulfobacterales bacterium]|nr:L,D-transpeptidase family protein [Desulfobacterales bacterium]